MYELSHRLYYGHQLIDDRHALFPFLYRGLGLRQLGGIVNGLKSRPTQLVLQLFSLLALTTETLCSGRVFRFSRLPTRMHLLRVTSQCHVLELFLRK